MLYSVVKVIMASAKKFDKFPGLQICQKCEQSECNTYMEDSFYVTELTDDIASLVKIKHNHPCYTIRAPTFLDFHLYEMDKSDKLDKPDKPAGYVIIMRTYLCETCITEHLSQLQKPSSH